MLRICQDGSVNCPDDFTGNFSSEADDTLDFITNRFGPLNPTINNLWTKISCGITFVSSISQADADQQAAASLATCSPCAGVCNLNPTFCNAAQTGCFPCPDGTLACFTVPAGSLCGYLNQASADSAALLLAQQLAKGNPVCPGPLTKCTCVGAGYMSQIIANVSATWSLTGGSLPPGLAFSGGTGVATSIFGIPTLAGTYTFQIEAQTSVGSFAIKTYSITVLQISTISPLPPYTVGIPYGPVQLQAIGGSGNYNWRVSSGTLPAGLIMSITGVISGTPTGP